MADREPFLTVSLLTFNRAEPLRRSLDCLLAQSYRNFELQINDDCSSDHTPEVGAEYERRDKRVRYFRNERNRRYAGNQNEALARSNGELVAIVHDGDLYREDCLEQWVAALSRHPDAGLVFNASDAVDAAGNVCCEYRHPYPEWMPGVTLLDDMFRVYSSPIWGIVMLRRSIVEQAGQFDEKFPVLADVDMWMRLLQISNVCYINQPLFRIFPREIGHANRGVNWRIIDEQYAIFRRNVHRRFCNDPAARAVADRAIRRKQRVKVARAIFWCVRHGQLHNASVGLRRFHLR